MIAMLAVVLLLLAVLVFAMRTAPMTGDRDANPAMSANGGAGSSITYDPYIERHAEVVQRLGDGRLR